MGKIALALTSADDGSLAAAERADLVELRLDHLGAPSYEALVDRFRGRCIVTYRKPDEGGVDGDVSEHVRLDLLARAAADERVWAVDFELGCHGHIPADPKAKIIVSSHDFEFTPHASDLASMRDEIESTPCDIVKIVTTARHEPDCFAVYSVLKGASKPIIALAMGEFGSPTRLVSLKLGAELTFAAAAEGKGSAPGQLALDEMLGLYRCREITAATSLYGVMGDPIAHSMSPAIHNRAYVEAGIDAVYLPFRVAGDPAEFVRRMVDEVGLAGMSVTIPHKEAVMNCLDHIDPVAKRIGAVNTIVVDAERGGPKLKGYNSDQRAACDSIEKAMGGEGSLAGSTVAVCGAGGAARAIVHGLADRGARVIVANRTRSRAETLAAEAAGTVEVLDPSELPGASFAALANATSVGMHPGETSSPVDPSALKEGMVVFDSVYNPLETKLMSDARAAGCVVVDGLEMFVGQGAVQFELWTGRPAPAGVMRSAALDGLRARGRKG